MKQLCILYMLLILFQIIYTEGGKNKVINANKLNIENLLAAVEKNM